MADEIEITPDNLDTMATRALRDRRAAVALREWAFNHGDEARAALVDSRAFRAYARANYLGWLGAVPSDA